MSYQGLSKHVSFNLIKSQINRLTVYKIDDLIPAYRKLCFVIVMSALLNRMKKVPVKYEWNGVRVNQTQAIYQNVNLVTGYVPFLTLACYISRFEQEYQNKGTV